MTDADHRIEEYTQLNENLRHYHNQRFAQLTLWLAITAGLLSSFFGESKVPSCEAATALKLMGIVSSLVFMAMDYRMVQHWRHFWGRLRELDAEFGFRMWRDRPPRAVAWLGSTPATYCLYTSVVVLWGFTLLWPSMF